MQMERTIILNDTDLRAALALPLDTATTWRRPIEDMVQRGANGGELLRVVPSMLINRGELFDAQYNLDNPRALRCPLGAPGDVVRVLERAYIAPPNFADRTSTDILDNRGRPRVVGYAASMDADSARCAEDYGVRLTYAARMPRWASRLTLRVTAVAVERIEGVWCWVMSFVRVAR